MFLVTASFDSMFQFSECLGYRLFQNFQIHVGAGSVDVDGDAGDSWPVGFPSKSVIISEAPPKRFDALLSYVDGPASSTTRNAEDITDAIQRIGSRSMCASGELWPISRPPRILPRLQVDACNPPPLTIRVLKPAQYPL